MRLKDKVAIVTGIAQEIDPAYARGLAPEEIQIGTSIRTARLRPRRCPSSE